MDPLNMLKLKFFIYSKKRQPLHHHPRQMDPEYAKAFYEQQQIRNQQESTLRKQQQYQQDRNTYAHIWEMPLPHSPTGRIPLEAGEPGTINPYGYSYRTDLTPNYQPSSGLDSHTLGKHEYQDIGDTRYFELDPEHPANHRHPEQL